MGTIAVDVKWQKETFKGVEVDLEQPPIGFKNQLFSLTGVAPERQKIMVKGGLLKDDGDWAKTGIKQGQRLMMMGTADVVPTAPKMQQVFVEDLPEDEQDTTGMAKYGAGLENLGNTCYMNSTLQCFYGVTELRDAVSNFALRPPDGADGGPSAAASGRVVRAASDLFKDLQRSAQPVPPIAFWMMLRQAYPQFDQQNRMGQYSQQDAEECWSQLMYSLRTVVKDPAVPDQSLIDRLFGVKLHTSLTCEESGETIEEDTTAYSLKCNISIEVNDLGAGMRLAFKDDREKRSDVLDRTVLFQGGSKVTALPPYLTVQFVRFYYKADVQQKAKILRKVAFPLVMDTYEFASDELKKELDGPRSTEAAIEEAADERVKRQKRAEADAADKKAADAKKKGSSAASADSAAASSGADAGGSSAAAPEAAAGGGDAEMADAEASTSTAVADLKAKHAGQPTGRYDLTAVLTHKGRSADSGHYVSWVKQPDGTWIQFDDQQMIVRKEEEVLGLSGGGDWHMAYLLVYKARTVAA